MNEYPQALGKRLMWPHYCNPFDATHSVLDNNYNIIIIVGEIYTTTNQDIIINIESI